MSKISISNMNLYYGDFHALKDVNLEIEPNKITAFIGPSGCGKSTLLKIISQIYVPEKGKVTVNGVEYTYNDTDSKWNDAAGKEVKIGTGAAAGEIKIGAGDKVSDGTTTLTAMTDAKDATGAANADGIDDNDNSVITAEKAYSLAKDELVAANHIGDTENTAAVAQDTTNKNVFTITTGSAKVANTLSFSLHVGADADMTNKITVDIDTMRSALGAGQNRLEHTIDNLDNISENTSSAESRIRDTDMAKEMVNYSKNNILAQAGQSMLAQANQSNQGVLSLLQ